MPKLKNAMLALKTIKGNAARHGAGYATSVRRFLHLYRNRRFSPREIYVNDLLNPRISNQALENYMSGEEVIAFENKHVLNAYLCATADKSVFYSLCSAAGVRIPRLLAIFDTPAGWTPDGRVLSSSLDWCTLIRSLPSAFIVKPALGLLGRGVAAFSREGNDFLDHRGHRRCEDELYAFLCNQKEQNLFSSSFSHHSLKLRQGSHKAIIQERLYAHPEIAELTGSAALCTCRILTHTDPSGTIVLIASGLRVINGSNVVDNFDSGANGNLWCGVDAETGRVVEAFAWSAMFNRTELITRHPTTARDIVGFRIPQWNEVVELARHLAIVFQPQPLIHWDIGITGDGPVVIEGNVGGHLLPVPLNRPVRNLLTEG